MAYETFPWATIGYPQSHPVIGDRMEVIRTPFEAGYVQTRAKHSRIIKTVSCYWRAMQSNEYLALVEFWRARNGGTQAFYLPFPLELAGFPVFGGPVGGSGPTGFEDTEVEVGAGNPPVFLVRFVGSILKAKWIHPHYFGVTVLMEMV